MFASLKNYIVQSYAEARKVAWPTRNQTINYSILVVGLCAGLGIFFALLDYGFSRIIARFLGA